MIKNNHLRVIAIFIIVLVLSIPFYPSYVFASANTASPDDELSKYYDMKTIPYDITYIEHMPLQEPDEACVAKAKDVEMAVMVMESDVIAVIAQAMVVLQNICAIETMIKTIISVINTILGNTAGCCMLPVIGEWLCQAVDKAKTFGFDIIFDVIDPICCVFGCGTCRPGNQCGGINLALGTFQPDPKASIYTALACLCIPAVLLHMRQLKLIYDTYNCCIQEACAKGISVEVCDRSFNYQTCAYWEGAMSNAIMALVAVFLAYLIEYLAGLLTVKNLGWMECILNWWDVIDAPITLAALLDAIDEFDEDFSMPDCKSLGFEEIDNSDEYKEEVQPYIVKLQDIDGDGRYDVVAKISAEEMEEIQAESTAEENAGDDQTDENSITGQVWRKITGMAEGDDEDEFAGEYTYETSDTYWGYELEDGRLILLPDDQIPPRDSRRTLIHTGDPSRFEKTYEKYETTDDVYPVYQGYELKNGDKVLIKEGDEVPDGAEETSVGTENPSDLKEYGYEVYDHSSSQSIREWWKTGYKQNDDSAEFTTALKFVNRVFGKTLNKEVEKYVEEKCAHELESSEPEDDSPSDNTLGSSDSLSSLEVDSFCFENPEDSSIIAQLSREGSIYTYYYNIISCKSALSVEIKLTGARVHTLAKESLIHGERMFNSSAVDIPHVFTDICVYTDDSEIGTDGVLCSPIGVS